MDITPQGVGWIEVICGSMFSGKTEELIRRLRLAQIARQKVIIFKPATDRRYERDQIVSHEDRRLPAMAVGSAAMILGLVEKDTRVVGIDEAQFFDMSLVGVCEALADGGKRVIVAGLDQDYKGHPFEPMPSLLALAEFITKKLAVCSICGNPANRSQRLLADQRRVLLGAKESYEARCRGCYERPAQVGIPLAEAGLEESPLLGGLDREESCPLAE